MRRESDTRLLPDAHLWPATCAAGPAGLEIGGLALAELAREHGTPLYVLDAATVRQIAAAYQSALAGAYPGETSIHYASKALLNLGVAQLMSRLGLGLDVVSGGELEIARAAGVDPAHVHLHGNGTPPAELARAMELGVGRIVVDNLDQLEALARLAESRHPAGARPQPIMLRIAPDVADGAHAHIRTGAAAAKFGLNLSDGAAAEAARRALASPGLELTGLHAHIGSQVRSWEALRETVGRLLAFAAELRAATGWTLRELSPGGGLAVAYLPDEQPGDIGGYARTIAEAASAGCAAHDLPLPRLVIEPGRSLIARAGVAIYAVTGRKAVSGGLPYLHIDGGMGDNARPALYGARYTARLVADPLGAPAGAVQIAGRYCESGDVLIREIELPAAAPGDLLAVPVAGAYTLSMSSAYNGVPRPALLLLDGGRAMTLQRRETVADLLRRDSEIELT